jgi:hypothetical protein
LVVANTNNGLLDSSSIDVTNTGAGLGVNFVQRTDYTNCNTAGWNLRDAQGNVLPASAGLPSCADLTLNSQPNASYTLLASDNNKVIRNTLLGDVVNNLPAPTGVFAFPFTFWVDTACASTVDLTPQTSLINGRTVLRLTACGWSMIWADPDGIDWHAQAYNPPGGVVFVP